MNPYDYLTTVLNAFNVKLPTKGSHGFRVSGGKLVLVLYLDQFGLFQEFGFDSSDMESEPNVLVDEIIAILRDLHEGIKIAE